MLKTINDRYSCRKYSDKLISREVLEKIVEAGRLAPSAHNEQPYHFYIITDDKKREIAKARKLGINKFIESATAFIVIAQEKSSKAMEIFKKTMDQDLPLVDIGIACSYMDLVAQSEGVGCCILGLFDEKKVQEIINCDKRIRIILALGYPDSDIKTRDKKRKSKEDIISWIE